MLTFILAFIDCNNVLSFSGWWYVGSVLLDLGIIGNAVND